MWRRFSPAQVGERQKSESEDGGQRPRQRSVEAPVSVIGSLDRHGALSTAPCASPAGSTGATKR